MNRYLALFLDLLLPPHCVTCGRSGDWFCPSCIAAVSMFKPPLCPHCGRPNAAATLCSDCEYETHSHLTGIRSVSAHITPLREAIHALKYGGMRVLADPLGEVLSSCWHQDPLPVSVIVPVPAHAARLRERGYNQSLLLARALIKHVVLPIEPNALIRQRNTRSQVGLGPAERQANVAEAFYCRPGALEGERILLLDDVYTTGATLEACASALLEARAGAVWALTLTRAVDTTSDGFVARQL